MPDGTTSDTSDTGEDTSAQRALGPDLLRLEAFGALYYVRATAEFLSVPPRSARLLAAATQRSVMELYVENPARWGIELTDLIREVVVWRQAGMLDENDRCPAVVVRGARRDESGNQALLGPMVTNVQLTRACNLKCGHCFVDIWSKRDPNELSLEQIDSLFGELASVGAPIVILAGGEPMLRPDFWEIADKVGEHGLDAALCTNATLIRDSNAARLVASPIRWYSISLDGPDAATHDELRGEGRFDHAVRGIRALMAAGADDVKIRVTVTGRNQHTLARFADVARELGVHKVVMKPFRHTAEGFGYEPNELYISRREYEAATRAAQDAWPDDAPPLDIDDGLPSGPPAWTKVIPTFGCVGGTTHASVIYDGRVVACDAVHDPDDWTLHHKSFLECWRGAPTVTQWRQLDGNSDCTSDCDNSKVCRGGCRARALGLGGTMDDPDPWSHCELPGPPQVRKLGNPALPIVGYE
jgi:radical SAM protein with 4Fe4S-binding SPASM domain